MGKQSRHQHVHIETNDDKTENKILNYLKQLKREIMGALEDVKAALALSNEKLDLLTPVVAGIGTSVPALAKDIAFIKKKLEGSPGGINAAGVAELLTNVADQGTKIAAISASLTTANEELKALDAETDSDEVVEHPVE